MASSSIRTTEKKHIIDIATIIGLLVAFTLVIMAIFLGGTPQAFINIPSVLIVVGGTFGVVIAGTRFRDFVGAVKYVVTTFSRQQLIVGEVALQLIELGLAGRQQGLLQMQGALASIQDKPMLVRGISLAIDGASDEEIQEIMTGEALNITELREQSISLLRKASESSPAMGLIGTLVGLVQMLAQLDDPSSIGPSMAVALLTTFYGVILAHMVFIPFANKLDRNGRDEDIFNRMYILSAASIQRQENPRRLEMLINALLPEREQITYFD
ncbi:MAG: MotA/TolQ/ExbB proton channel family protein [Alphaproteobacteria bacterium]|nr:MotA/TolQ/ExbB proton channel family protein [Alphaproteobacteria bacterium]